MNSNSLVHNVLDVTISLLVEWCTVVFLCCQEGELGGSCGAESNDSGMAASNEAEEDVVEPSASVKTTSPRLNGQHGHMEDDQYLADVVSNNMRPNYFAICFSNFINIICPQWTHAK